MRRQFDLPEEDVTFLDSSGFQWEAVCEGLVKRVVLKDHPVPPGYNIQKCDVVLRIESTYPDCQIDMAYFNPPLVRADGKPIQAITDDPFDGKVWQRWSRHRTPQSPWRPGIDCVETHLVSMNNWLTRELQK